MRTSSCSHPTACLCRNGQVHEARELVLPSSMAKYIRQLPLSATWYTVLSLQVYSFCQTLQRILESMLLIALTCRDMVDRKILAHFRAHTSPLLLLQFDASGTLLVTASVHGHTVNVYHISAASKRGEMGGALHLFRLSRGVTPAVIQAVAFSCDGRWLAVSSARVLPSLTPWLMIRPAPCCTLL